MTDRPDWGHGPNQPVPMWMESEIREVLATSLMAHEIDAAIAQLRAKRDAKGACPTPDKVYIITSGIYSAYGIHRVYLDEDEARRVCSAHNAATTSDYGDWDVETWDVGICAAYDGPLYSASWTFHPKGAYFYGKGTPDDPHHLAEDYESWLLPDGTDNNRSSVSWHVGEDPGKAKVTEHWSAQTSGVTYVTVTGTDPETVKKALYDTVAQHKAQKAGIT